MIQHNWSKLKGEALENYAFRTSNDPRVEWSISNGKAVPDDFLGIVQYYKYEIEKLSCCLCGAARHNGGAVVQLKDNSYRLVGSCCGREHFKDQWNISSNALSAAEREANYRIKARKILTGRSDVMQAIEVLRNPCRNAELARLSLERLFGMEFSRVVTELFRSVGRLQYEVDLSGTIDGQGARGSLKSTVQDTDPVSGWEMFTANSWERLLENINGRTKISYAELQQAMDKGHTLFSKIKNVRKSIDEINHIFNKLNEIILYNNSRNAEIIDFWFEKRGIPFRVYVEDGIWVVKTHSKIRTETMLILNRTSVPAPFRLLLSELG